MPGAGLLLLGHRAPLGCPIHVVRVHGQTASSHDIHVLLPMQIPSGASVQDLLPLLSPEQSSDTRLEACNRLLPLVTKGSPPSAEFSQLLQPLLAMLQLSPDQIPGSLYQILAILAVDVAAAKIIIRGPSLDRLAALLRQGDHEEMPRIIALLDALAGHAQYLPEFAKSNVIFELLAVLEDLKTKSASKRRAASSLLMTLFNASVCCEQVTPAFSLPCSCSILHGASAAQRYLVHKPSKCRFAGTAYAL